MLAIEKKFRMFIGIFLALLLSGCATADLFPKNIELTEDAAQQGKLLLLSAMQRRDPQDLWSQFKFLKVIARDEWQSQTARLFTPIPQAAQQVQFAFNLRNKDAFMKFLDGDLAGNIISIEGGRTFFIAKEQRTEKSSKRVSRYLPPVCNYFLWPQIIHKMPNIVYLGEADEGLRHYDKIFASGSESNGTSGSESLEQYVVWINRQTLHIEYIEFTLKELSGSYHGVVQYREYRDEAGVIVPHEITLLDKMGDLSFSHKLYVQIMTLE